MRELNSVKAIKELSANYAAKNHTHSYLPLAGGTLTGPMKNSYVSGTYLAGNQGNALVSSIANPGSYVAMLRYPSTSGYYTLVGYQGNINLQYTVKATVDAGTNSVTKTATLLNEAGNSTFPGTVTAPTFSGALSGNATTATTATKANTLTTARTINGTSFNGSANITTANWGTARTITIGNTGKSVNGAGNVSWSLSEIGAAAASHSHSYLSLSGGTTTGPISVKGESKFYVSSYTDPWNGTSCALKATGHIATTGTVRAANVYSTGKVTAGKTGIDTYGRLWQGEPASAFYIYTSDKDEGVGFDYEGYVRPQGDSTWSCGHPSWRWSTVYSRNGVSTSSDGKWKKHIKYIISEEELEDLAHDYIPSNDDYVMSTFTYEGDTENKPSPVLSATSSEKVYEFTKELYAKDISLDITTNDLYKFFKDNFQLTSYRFDINMYHNNEKRNNELNNVGFIAQDIVNTKVGKLFIVAPEEDDKERIEEKGYTYNLQNYTSIIAGALKSAINEIEILKKSNM